MKKMVLLISLSLMIFSIPAFSTCSIEKMEECTIKKEKPQIKHRIKNSMKSFRKQILEKYSASCEFGVCSPKPPKR